MSREAFNLLSSVPQCGGRPHADATQGALYYAERAACDDCAARLIEAARADVVRERDELRALFRHTHHASKRGDSCAICGLDLRNLIHCRTGQSPGALGLALERRSHTERECADARATVERAAKETP